MTSYPALYLTIIINYTLLAATVGPPITCTLQACLHPPAHAQYVFPN